MKSRKQRQRARENKARKELMKQKGARRVTILRDTSIKYPGLYLDVYISGEDFELKNFAPMFARSACKKVDTPEEADLVVFTGGPDVNPSLYGQSPHRRTRTDTTRDTQDIELFNLCVREGIPMFGVCRGMQFIHVMMGGTLYQHVDGHNAPHSMLDVRAGTYLYNVSSVHHQAVMESKDNGMEILATSQQTATRFIGPHSSIRGSGKDIEALFYRDICAFGVQGHPEYRGYPLFTKWTLERLYELITCNPDLVREDSVLRLTEAYRDQRQQKWAAELFEGVGEAIEDNKKEVN